MTVDTLVVEPLLHQVHPEMTLQSLPLWKVEIDIDQVGDVMMRRFNEEPRLPGVILLQDQQYVGMVSRQKFFERMSRPYALELFSNRVIRRLYDELRTNSLELPVETRVITATPLGLKRSSEYMYEPIVVRDSAGSHRLVDFQELLIVYSKIHAIILEQLQYTQLQADKIKTNLAGLQSSYAQMLHTEKMASLGQLVAGIAHEINNPVNFIHGNLAHAATYARDLLDLVRLYCRHYPEPHSAIQEALELYDLAFLEEDFVKLLGSMEVGTVRIQEIVKSMRNFSRLDESDRKSVDIHEGIENTLTILNHRLKGNPEQMPIEVVKDYGDLPLVDCYPGQLNQVFTNILSNAIDALQESAQPPLKITIQTQVKEYAALIVITDSGPGISQEKQQRIFDPFFTTKPIGKGTGLGLSISHQIITKGHNGHLTCKSQPAQGTEFVIEIPLRIGD